MRSARFCHDRRSPWLLDLLMAGKESLARRCD
jgi:hypothetical protein